MKTDPEEASEKTLTRNALTSRWHVGDYELHAGDVFELKLAGGHWVPVRFEWVHHDGKPPTGYCVLSLADGHSASTFPPHGSVVRMPAEFG